MPFMICSRFLGKLDDIPPLSEVGWCHVKKSRNSPELISGKIQVQGSKYSEILFKFNPIISKIWSFSQVYDSWDIPLPLVHLYLLFPSICCWDVWNGELPGAASVDALLMAAQQYLERTICSALLQLQLPQVEGSHMLVVGRWGFGGRHGSQICWSRVFVIDEKQDRNDFDGWHKWNM